MDNINVCLMNDSFPPEIDGVANAVTNYARIINAHHGAASVVTPSHPQADDAAFGFPVLRYPSVDMTRLVGYRAGLPFSPEVMGRLEEGQFDLIHSHCPISSTMLARMLRERINAPVVFTYHTKFDVDIANVVSSRLLREEAARILVENISACDEVWTVSRGAGENLRALGYEGEYIVMPNGVDFPRGRVENALIDEVTRGVDLPAGVPVFLFVGRMMWYKGIKIILDALKALAAAGRQFRMVFVGGGTDKEEIVQYAEELGLGESVHFCSPIHDRARIRAWYCRADLFLFPSTFDTNGLVVREAAACALASVLIAGSCASEGVTDGVNGFLIKEDAASMADKLMRLVDAPEVMRRVGEGAQNELYMSWEEAVSRAWARYHAVIDNYRAGKYPPRERLSDEMLRAAARGLDMTNHAIDTYKKSVADFMDEVSEERVRLAGTLRAEREQLIDDVRENRANIKARLDRTTDILKAKDRE